MLIAMVSMAAASCSSDNDDDDSSDGGGLKKSYIIGTWEIDETTCSYTFETSTRGYYKEKGLKYEFSYTLTDEYIIIIYDEDDTKEILEIISSSSSKIVVEDRYGRDEVWIKKGSSNTSPSYDDDDDDNYATTYSLVGTWRLDFDGGYQEVTFKSNGTGIMHEYYEWYGETESYTFSYTYNESSKRLKIIDEDGDTQIFYIESITSTKFVMEDEDGYTYTLTKQN